MTRGATIRRKREGVVYTPDDVAGFLVARTLGMTLQQRFAALMALHADGAGPVDGSPVAWRSLGSERAFWHDYAHALGTLTVVDPACGAGALLVAAFDRLAAEYRRVAERLLALGEPVALGPPDALVTRALHGVDREAGSVEATRLALWSKAVRGRHPLSNLEATIRVGDSLIDDPAFTERPFDWPAAFPEVFAAGGFDVVIGNPPYVRMELIKAVKPYLEKHYVVSAGRTDLSAFFLERGVGLLKPGGRLGYITSSTFFRTGSGENLRAFLRDTVTLEAVVDFGDLQIFEGVTTYPAILTLRKGVADQTDALSFMKVEALPMDLDAEFVARARPMPCARLGTGSWQFEDAPLAALRDKIAGVRRTLGEVHGAPLYGIKTGLNDAFVVDTATRDRLVAQDPGSADLLVPFLRGENIRRWRVEPEGLFLINTPKGEVDIDAYPAVRDRLLAFRPELEKRATRQEWFELQQAQLAYQSRFRTNKISYGHFASGRIFAWEPNGYFSNDKSYFIPDATFELLALLNSRLAWFVISGLSPAVRGGFHEMRVRYVAQVPIPDMTAGARAELARLGAACTTASGRRFEVQSAVRRRILDLAPEGSGKLSRKLADGWTLGFAAFRDEVKRVFHTDIAVRERADWEAFLAESRTALEELSAEIAAAEREIDAIVYRLFDLTGDEIARLEASLGEQP